MKIKFNKATYAQEKILNDKSDSKWQVERNIYKVMEELDYFEEYEPKEYKAPSVRPGNGSYQRLVEHRQEHTKKEQERKEKLELSNIEKCECLINAGADILITCGTRANRYIGMTTEITAITPKATINMNSNGQGYSFQQSKKLSFYDGYKLDFFKGDNTRSTTYTKDASVIGQAVAGAVIAGPAGAVVGALNASNTNAKGGKTKTITEKTGEKIFTIHLPSGDILGNIFLSTSFMDKYGYPPEKFVKTKTKKYWIIEDGVYFYRCGFNELEDKYKELVDYINKAISSYQRELDSIVNSRNEEIKNENKQEINESLKKSFKKKKKAIILIIVAILLIIGGIIGVEKLQKENAYKEAIGYFEAGDYSKSYDAFYELNGYKESEKYMEVHLAIEETLKEENNKCYDVIYENCHLYPKWNGEKIQTEIIGNWWEFRDEYYIASFHTLNPNGSAESVSLDTSYKGEEIRSIEKDNRWEAKEDLLIYNGNEYEIFDMDGILFLRDINHEKEGLLWIENPENVSEMIGIWTEE